MARTPRSRAARRRPAGPEARRVRHLLLRGAELLEQSADRLPGPLSAAAAEIARRLAGGGTVFFFGNGGSASQAQHFAAEITGRFKLERPGLAAVALGTNPAELSAIANDYAYEQVFSRPLAALAKRGDAAVGLSGSGGSGNVVAALKAARKAGAFTVAMTGLAKGPDGGPVGRAADLALVAPASAIAEVQEIHLALGHALCGLIEEALAGRGRRRAGR